MSDLTSYRYLFDGNDPYHRLLEHLHADGVTDEEIDRGFCQIDYYRPGEWGPVEGAQDFRIDKREVLEYAAANWKKYAPVIEKTLGMKTYWSLETFHIDPKTAEEREVSLSDKHLWNERLTEAISIIESDLQRLGIAKGSDEYRFKFADALNTIFRFPNKNMMERFEKKQIEDFKKQLKFDDLGMPTLCAFLLENGGYGERPAPDNSYQSSIRSCQIQLVCITGIFLLYNMMDTAGLEPIFVELTGMRKDRLICNETYITRTGIALKSSAGDWKVFDPIMGRDNPEREIFYPLSHRQALENTNNMGDLAKKIVKTEDPFNKTVLAETETSADGIKSMFYIFRNILAIKDDSDDGKKALARTLSSDPKKHHPIFYPIILMATSKDDVSAMESMKKLEGHTGIPDNAFLSYVYMISSSFSKLPEDVIRTHLDRLIDADPSCNSAYDAYLDADYEGTITLDTATKEDYYKKALNGVPSSDSLYLKLQFRRAEHYQDSGRTEEAKEILLSILRADKNDLCWKGNACLLWAFIEASDGNGGIRQLKELMEFIEKKRPGLDDLKDMEAVLKYAVKLSSNERYSKVINENPEFRLEFMNTLALLSRFFLKYGKPERALPGVEKAITISDDLDWLAHMIVKHEILLQQGKIAEAKALWTEIDHMMFEE
ncbi:MAG TPA: hypothetical protein PKU96_05200 [bacterium]|nr:hypothetical protein [bacterium]